MVDPNKVSSTGENTGDRPTGWESVAEMAGQMNPKEQNVEFEDKSPVQEESNVPHEKVALIDNIAIESAESKEIDPKKVTEIDRYMMANLEMDNPAERTAMAHYVADFAGVASGVKPTALVVISPSNMNMEMEQLAKLIDEAGMQVADGWENGRFFISRSKDLATQSKEQFHRLWSGERTPEVDYAIGELLGYPKTAISQDFSERPKGILAKLKHIGAKRVRPELEWHYVHNPEFQDEEFEAYEKPLHEYMDANCPVAASILKTEKTSLGKPKRWLQLESQSNSWWLFDKLLLLLELHTPGRFLSHYPHERAPDSL